MIRQTSLVLMLSLALSVSVRADEFKHEVRVMGKLGNHPNIVQFIGLMTVDVTITPSAVGDNPLYEDRPLRGNNPLYTPSAAPGTPEAIQSVSLILDNTALTPSAAGNGIVHRDIAARNILVQTNQGLYESALGEFLLFGNDGPPDLRAQGVGPIRWMAPESLRLHRTGASDPNDWIEIDTGSFFEVNYAIPEPTTVALVILAGATMLTRRRGQLRLNT